MPAGSEADMKAADVAVRNLAAVCGVPYGHYTTSETKPPELPGNSNFESETRYCVERSDGGYFVTLPSGLVADYNPTYGGYVIEQIAPNGRTRISHPFKQERLTGPRFVAYVSELIERIVEDDSLADHVRQDLAPESDQRTRKGRRYHSGGASDCTCSADNCGGGNE